MKNERVETLARAAAEKRRGLYAAPFTPFHGDGRINFDLVPQLATRLAEQGLSGAFVCGSNGEGPSLSSGERMDLAAAWIAAAPPGFETLVHVGHSSIREAQHLMAHAAEVGASAASAVASFYFKPDGVERLVDCLEAIAGAAPELPFYYYHIPAITGVGLDVVRLLELSAGRIPNLAGVKYTAPTLWEFQACLSACNGRFDMMFGMDEMLFSALSLGATAAIGSTYNFAAPLYLKVFNDFEAGRLEDARQQMSRLVEMVRILLRFPPIPAQKEIMRKFGFDHGRCRLPLAQLSDSQAGELYHALDSIGFWSDVQAAQPAKSGGVD